MVTKLTNTLAILCVLLGLTVAAHAALIVNGQDLRARLLDRIYGHFETKERWCGKSADQSGTNWMSPTAMTPFAAGAEGSQWGALTKLVGSSDTPIIADQTAYKVRRLYITDVAFPGGGRVKVRVIWGNGTASAAVQAGQYTEVMVPNDSVEASARVMMPRVPATTKLWAQMWAIDAEATFLIGLAEHK
jgi:hypothetical protein